MQTVIENTEMDKNEIQEDIEYYKVIGISNGQPSFVVSCLGENFSSIFLGNFFFFFFFFFVIFRVIGC